MSTTPRLSARPMRLDEVDLIIEYFHGASPEHLEMLGVDPTRLPERKQWKQRYEDDFARPIAERRAFLVVWQLDEASIGFSTADKIKYGVQANMHLHIVDPSFAVMGSSAHALAIESIVIVVFLGASIAGFRKSL
jgi:hypothetical protein